MFVLLRFGLKYTKKHLLQSILLILGVALGVAVIIAIDLANISASKAFHLSSESLTGKATHQIISPRLSFDESIYKKIRVDLGIRNSAPVVQDYVIAKSFNNKPMRVFGVDPFAEAPFRNYLTTDNSNVPVSSLTSFLTEPNTALLEKSFAEENHIKVGDSIDIEYNSRPQKLKISGLLQVNDNLSREAISSMIITDISTAQEVLNKVGKLNYIDLIVNDKTEQGRKELNKIRSVLPKGLSIETPETRNSALEQMSSAFELNLSALSLLALVVGMFLIYNTVTFSVIQRRNIIGILRALGVTREQIFTMIVSETAILGLIGTILGLGLGVILGQGSLYLVTRTINDLYFTLNTTNVEIAPFTMLKGATIGIFASIFASAIPAFEATRVAPVGTMKRSVLENSVQKLLPWITLSGLVLGLLGMLLFLIPSKRIDISFAGLFIIVIGTALIVPIGTVFIMKILAPVTKGLLGVIGKMAPRSIVRSLSRTTVAIAALMVAVSVIVGVSIMIGSFRQTVVSWLDTTLTADIFISSPTAGANFDSGFAETVINKIKKIKGIDRIATARSIKIQTKNYGFVLLSSVSEDIAHNRKFLWTNNKSPNDIWNEIKKGSVMVSESFAYHNHIKSDNNSFIKLETSKGQKEFKVSAIYYDYSSDRGTIFMSSNIYQNLWDDNQVTSIGAFISKDSDLNQIIKNIRENITNSKNLTIQSNKSLRDSAMDVFDRTFAITDALRLLAGLVAFIGVFSTLMSLQLERTKEFGIMRATGMTVRQVQSLIMLETGLMGFSAGILALPVGIILALVLIHIINLRSFGWTLELILKPDYFFQALIISLVASLVAGIYPAIKIKYLQPTSAIRNE
ncbi:MAG: FtsX-like permease family protein [Candidatus Sericytochromatia bacterium]|nr:FtsX-like permease family protein [Candidatus Sericytochromatia bacterium]